MLLLHRLLTEGTLLGPWEATPLIDRRRPSRERPEERGGPYTRRNAKDARRHSVRVAHRHQGRLATSIGLPFPQWAVASIIPMDRQKPTSPIPISPASTQSHRRAPTSDFPPRTVKHMSETQDAPRTHPRPLYGDSASIYPPQNRTRRTRRDLPALRASRTIEHMSR